MAKTKPKSNSFDPNGVDILALIFAGSFMHSVLTTFHHAAINQYIGPPTWWSLGVAALLTAYSVRKQKKLSVINAVVLTVLAVSALFWVSGLRANFYF